jgi:hypothetical protein
MAIGFGLGIGLQGTPKDYVDLVKSREAAKQKAAATKGAKEQAAAQRLYEKFTYDLGKVTVLPIHEAERDKIVNEAFTLLESEMDSDVPNFNRANLAITQAKNQLNEIAAQKKSFDNFAVKGSDYGFSPQELQTVGSISDPKQMNDAISKVGVNTFYDPNTNRFAFSPVFDYKPTDQSFNEHVGKVGKFLFNDASAGTKYRETINGKTYTYYGLNPDFQASWVNAQMISPSSAVDFKRDRRNKGLAIPDLATPQGQGELKTFLENSYKEKALPLLERVGTGKSGEFNVNIGGEDEYKPGKVSTEFTVNRMGGNAKLSWGSFGSFPVDTEGVGKVATNLRNVTTLKPIDSSTGTFKSGTADLAIVSSRKINLSMNGQAVTIEKGEVIPVELQKQVNPSDTKVGVVMVGEFTPTGGGTTQSVFSSTDQDDFTRAYFKGDKGEKKLIIDAQETLKKRLENLNALSPEKRNEILQKYDSWTDYLNSDEAQQTSAPSKAPAAPKSNIPASGGTTGGKAAYDRQYWKTRGGFPAWQKSATGK